ncbi:MAG TPA: DnaB-like helicase C-terminal domain-containing protein, partial [Acidimicrobiales bacterium]|nr:DnaB-like helicase C-terminal domain-containing protein [Acidimicrobiales bacterium]
ATADEANKLAVETAARRAFGIEVQEAKRARTWQLRLPSPYPVTAGRRHPIRNWLEPHGLWGSRSGTRFLPESLFALPDDRLALFLHHLWATDGSLTLGRNARGPMVRTYYATTSRQLALHVQRALLRLAIRSRLVIARKAGSVDCWHVVVQSAPDQSRFLSLVGCHGAGGQAVAEARRVLDSAPLPDQATSDVAWDEVLEITALGEQPTFDATVPGTHNFVADGVIAHNSLEQDADVVMFLYRDELYNPESPDRGTAEVIVSKHRNGPTGVARLAFLEHYTRFANMARV